MICTRMEYRIDGLLSTGIGDSMCGIVWCGGCTRKRGRIPHTGSPAVIANRCQIIHQLLVQIRMCQGFVCGKWSICEDEIDPV